MINEFYEQYHQKGGDYVIPVEVFDSLIEEYEELKKQLENKEDFIKKLQATKDRLDRYNYEITMQQQKFIVWLENMLDNNDDIFSVVRVRDVLNKYKVIGKDINVAVKGV